LEVNETNLETKAMKACSPIEQAFLVLANAEQRTAFAITHPGLDLRSHLYDIERALIRQAMERAGGTVAHGSALYNCAVPRWWKRCVSSNYLDDQMSVRS